jgi:SAM-dependent methyltransferase
MSTGAPKIDRAEVRRGLAVGDCDFYHTVDVPGHGVVAGQWDLRGAEAAYLGGIALQGRSVLEIGPATGHLGFWMERQGARLTVLDLGPDNAWDLVPVAGVDLEALLAERREHLRRLQNGWWLLHERLGSQAAALRGTVYDLGPDVGQFDVVTLNAVLLHLRDPMGALIKAASVCRQTLVVSEIHESFFADDAGTPVEARLGARIRRLLGLRPPVENRPRMAAPFIPRTDGSAGLDAWFYLPSAMVAEMMRILGFEVTVTEHVQNFQGRPYRMYTAVGERG